MGDVVAAMKSASSEWCVAKKNQKKMGGCPAAQLQGTHMPTYLVGFVGFQSALVLTMRVQIGVRFRFIMG